MTPTPAPATRELVERLKEARTTLTQDNWHKEAIAVGDAIMLLTAPTASAPATEAGEVERLKAYIRQVENDLMIALKENDTLRERYTNWRGPK